MEQQVLPNTSVLPGVIVVLGAGASRDVSYAGQVEIPSPLDTDFFDLLQRTSVRPDDEEAKRILLHAARGLQYDSWRSFERAFYTLHLRALMSAKLDDEPYSDVAVSEIVERVTRCLEAVLREAHGTKMCRHHNLLFAPLREADTILSFNYDLVAERAIASIIGDQQIEFGKWLYGMEAHGLNPGLPTLLKLHGSSNWSISDAGEIGIITKDWNHLYTTPGYRASTATFDDPARYPILLPFWDKPIERPPWLTIWKDARRRLGTAAALIVWGYSLAPTDIKTQHLFSLALANRQRPLNLCIIDPSRETQRRWRELLPDAKFWTYPGIHAFFQQPPHWWRARQEATATEPLSA